MHRNRLITLRVFKRNGRIVEGTAFQDYHIRRDDAVYWQVQHCCETYIAPNRAGGALGANQRVPFARTVVGPGLLPLPPLLCTTDRALFPAVDPDRTARAQHPEFTPRRWGLAGGVHVFSGQIRTPRGRFFGPPPPLQRLPR